MESVDGDIRLNVGINSKKATTDLRNEIKAISDIIQKTSGTANRTLKSVSSDINKTVDNMNKLATQIDELNSKMKALENVKLPTDEYKEVADFIKKSETELNKLLDKQAEMVATGNTSGKSWDTIQYKIDEAKNTITYARGELQQLVDTGKAFVLGKDTQEYTDMANEAERLSGIYNQQEQQLYLLSDEYDAISSAASNSTSAIESGASRNKSTLKAIKSGLASIVSMLGRIGKKFISAFNKKPLESTNKSITKLVRNLLKYTLGIRSLYVLFNKLKSAGKEALTTMATEFDDVNKDISAIVSSFTTLKNSIGTLVQPLVSALAPALTTIMDAATKASEAVATFFATLTGQNYIYKATKANIDYAASQDSVSNSTKESNKQLGAYDDLQVISKNDTSSSASGTGSDSGSSFEKVAISTDLQDGIANMIANIKSMWEQADFTDLGATIGSKINTALSNIPWTDIQTTVNKVAQSITTLLNGLLDGTDFKLLGSTLGQGINTALGFITTTVNTFKWGTLGSKMADYVNGLFSTIKWSEIGSTFANSFNGIFTTIQKFAINTDWSAMATDITTSINTFLSTIDLGAAAQSLSSMLVGLLDLVATTLETLDWQQLAYDVMDFITGIDYSGIFSAFCEGLGAAFGGIAAFLFTIVGEAITSIGDYFSESIDEAGGNIAEGILCGICNALVGLGNWILDNILFPFIDGFAEAMGISDLLETGANFIAGLLEGIVGGLKNIGTWIKENIFNPIVNWFKDLFGIHSPSTVFAEFGGYMMEGLKNGVNNAIEAVKKVVTKVWTTIKGVFSTVKTWFTNLFKGAWNGIKTAFSSVKTFFSGIWTKIKACFSAVKTWFSSLFSGAWEKIKNAFSSVKSFFSGIWTKIKGVFSSVGTWFKEKFTGAWDKIKEVFSLDNVKQFFSDVWEGVKGCFGKVSSWFSETFAGAWQGIKDIFSKGGEVFSGIVDGVADTFKSVVNTLIDGINAVIKTPFTKINGMLNTIHDVSIAGFQPFSGLWSKDPLPIPQIPKLAEGAVLPANKPFLAMLGDQKNGTNVETPLATMIEAFNTALDSRASSSGDIPQTIQLVLDMTGVKLLAECIWDEQEKKYKQTNSRESRVTRFT